MTARALTTPSLTGRSLYDEFRSRLFVAADSSRLQQIVEDWAASEAESLRGREFTRTFGRFNPPSRIPRRAGEEPWAIIVVESAGDGFACHVNRGFIANHNLGRSTGPNGTDGT